MRRTIDPIRLCMVCAVLMAACGVPAPEEGRTADAESSFASFAREVYAELAAEPLDPNVQTSVGLFGDLNVMSGENVIMGRYRFRVDTTSGDPQGQMAFHVSPSSDPGAAVPVVLEFSSRNGAWRLEDASYMPSDAASDVTGALKANLQDWVSDGVHRARSAGGQP